MRVLVTVENSPKRRLLVKLDSKAARDVKDLLCQRNRDRAIMTALTKGELEGRVNEADVQNAEADLILTRDGAHWNLS